MIRQCHPALARGAVVAPRVCDIPSRVACAPGYGKSRKSQTHPNPLRQISKSPAHNAMDSRDRPSLDLLRQPGAWLII